MSNTNWWKYVRSYHKNQAAAALGLNKTSSTLLSLLEKETNTKNNPVLHTPIKNHHHKQGGRGCPTKNAV